jgi:hypothetical protein
MADDNKAPSMGIETGAGKRTGFSVDMGEGKGAKAKPFGGDGVTAQFDPDGKGGTKVTTKVGLGGEPEDDAAGGAQQPAEGTEPEGEEPGEGEDTSDLGDYDPASEESVAAYDKRFTSGESGTLNMAALTQEWDANKGAGLKDGTYAYLEDRFGIPKDVAKEVEQGLVAQRSMAQAAIGQAAGGVERLTEMIAWGGKGGYTKAQIDKFNAVMAGTDQDAKLTEIAALSDRFSKATGKPHPGGRRKARPERDATDVAKPSGGVQGFRDYTEYSKARREARNANNGRGDQAAIELVQKRLRASDWHKKR